MASRKETERPEKQIPLNINGSKPTIPVTELMSRMGVPNGFFDPLPPDQRKWQADADVDNSQLHRVWSWLVAHTVGNSACRRDYAVNQHGHERHLEHIAADLEMDPANVRATWRKGERKGLWRWGTKQEGERRLYLCGTVQSAQDIPERGEEKAAEVCTNLIPSSISLKLKGWPDSRRLALEEEWRRIERINEELFPICVAAARSFISREQNNLLARYGVKHEIQEHRKKGESEEEEKARRERVKLFLPAVANFVQSLHPELCTEPEKVCTEGSDHLVQTSLYRKENLENREARPSGRAESPKPRHASEPPARPQVVSQSPPHQNGNGKTKTEDWRPELREWLRENCPVKTALDDVMFERIAFWLSPELLGQFREAALEVKNPRKWPVYESVAKQVASRGEVPDAPVSRKEQRRQEWEQEMLQKFGKEA